MLVELDGFDRLVDRLGEAAGARIVLATARTLRAEARAADRCARLGRGRFAVLLPETDEVRAINFVERVRCGVRPLARGRRDHPAARDRLGDPRSERRRDDGAPGSRAPAGRRTTPPRRRRRLTPQLLAEPSGLDPDLSPRS